MKENGPWVVIMRREQDGYSLLGLQACLEGCCGVRERSDVLDGVAHELWKDFNCLGARLLVPRKNLSWRQTLCTPCVN
jgi:hypothetical protein